MYKLLKREILHKNKIFIISLLFLFIFLLLHTNKVYANGYSFVIEDDADLYTSEEEEMLKEDYNDIADNQNNPLYIHFYGGEPLVYIKKIKEIVKHLDHKNIKFSIITNGSLITSKITS